MAFDAHLATDAPGQKLFSRTDLNKQMKRGILLLNFGGPWTISDVKPFLYRLFSNPRVLVGVPTPFRQAPRFYHRPS
jgi:hypothetical protein